MAVSAAMSVLQLRCCRRRCREIRGSIHDVVLHAFPPAELDESHVWQSQQRVDPMPSCMGPRREFRREFPCLA